VTTKAHALAPFWRYHDCMPSIQIKNVPPGIHRIFRQRAAAAGQSLQEYLLAELKQQAQEETLDEVLDRAGGRAGGSVGLGFAAETLRADRKRAA
jgi:antitoxin FitA